MLRHRRKHSRAYGMIWDESTSTPAGVRVGQGASAAPSSALPANLAILQSLMKRCVINDAGVVQYYLDPSDSALKENGDAANLDGTDGQVMVEIPMGWHKYEYANNQHMHIICKEQFNGAERLDAYYKNGAWVQNRYIGAYEGTLYDASRSAYTNGLQLTASSTTFDLATKVITQAGRTHPFTLLEVGDKIVVAGTTNNDGTFTVATGGTGDQSITVDEALTDETAAGTTIETQKNFINDILSSVSGKAPINYGTRANFRALAGKHGTGWRQQDFDLVSAIQLLYLVEYADWNSQSMIGNGLTDWTSAWPAWNDYNPIETSGNSNSDGNATANTSGGDGAVGSYMSYHGIENFFSHLWKWVDGINIIDRVPWVSNNDTHFVVETTTNYTSLGVTLATSNQYVETLEQIARGFLAASVLASGSGSTYVTDFYWQGTGWRLATLGANANNALRAGVACWFLGDASGHRNRALTSRLAF